jgi:protein TonB
VSPPPPPPPPAPDTRPDTPRPPNPDAAPIDVPDAITPEPNVDFTLTNAANAVGVDGVPGGDIIVGELPPPPPVVAKAPPKPVIVGGKIRPPQKIRDAQPLYPAIAQAARVQGTVILQARIGVDGTVEDLQVLRSIPLLDQAAIEAVSQWQYQATLLNNVPVPVIMTVTVTFTLGGK